VRANASTRKDRSSMSQWGVQLVIGKLMTDEEFRFRFEDGARDCLDRLREQGIDLSDREVAAFLETDAQLWSRMARQIERRFRTSAEPKPPKAADQPAHAALTDRERHVLRGIFEGLTNKQIGTDLGVSEAAVKATLQHLFRKTQVRTRAQLVRIVVEGSFDAPPSGR
jgi:DNA-binding NarL/FixJ family response regulator